MGKGAQRTTRLPAVAAPRTEIERLRAARREHAKRLLEATIPGQVNPPGEVDASAIPEDPAQYMVRAVRGGGRHGRQSYGIYVDSIDEAARVLTDAVRTPVSVDGAYDLDAPEEKDDLEIRVVLESTYAPHIRGCVAEQSEERVFTARSRQIARERYGDAAIAGAEDRARYRYMIIERDADGSLTSVYQYALHEALGKLAYYGRYQKGFVAIWDLAPLSGPVEVPVVVFARVYEGRRVRDIAEANAAF